MKLLFKVITLAAIVSAIFSSCAPITDNVMKRYEKENFLYLIAGFDDTAENTDVLFTLGYDKISNSIKIAQIPRDTYADFGASQNKINQYYATAIYAGASKVSAMEKTVRFIGSLFGAEFDGYIGLGTSAFRHIVDALGGVEISVSEDMLIEIDGEAPLKLKSGVNFVDGSDAEKFIRYRKGYVMGDLARIDAQKLFLSALLSKLSQELTLPTLMKIAGILQNEAITDIKLASFSSIIMNAIKGGTAADYITVPGEPAISKSGLSFYVLNRKTAAETAKRYMFAKNEFDPDRKFLNENEYSFVNIYEDTDFSIREYGDASLPKIQTKRSN